MNPKFEKKEKGKKKQELGNLQKTRMGHEDEASELYPLGIVARVVEFELREPPIPFFFPPNQATIPAAMTLSE
jgi:hypothetical protein